jgi:hypothetical protein
MIFNSKQKPLNMKLLLTTSIFLVIGFLSVKGQNRDHAAIKEVLKEAYADGVFNEGRIRNIELGFSPQFQMIVNRGDSVEFFGLDNWIDQIEKHQVEDYYPVPKEQEVRLEIESIDVVQDVASVRLKFFVGKKARYIDFIDLYKYSTGWKIVSKTFTELPQTE